MSLSVQEINGAFYEKHKGVLAPLLQESAALRHDELDWVKWFAETTSSDMSEESRNQLFRLVFRDIHKAQDEVQSRILSFDDAEKARLSEENQTLENKISELKKELSQAQKDNQVLTEKVKNLSANLNSIYECVEKTESYKVWDLKGVLTILKQFAEWYKGDSARLEINAKEVLSQAEKIQGCNRQISKEVEEVTFINDKPISREQVKSIFACLNDDGGVKSLCRKVCEDAGHINSKSHEIWKIQKELSELFQEIKRLSRDGEES